MLVRWVLRAVMGLFEHGDKGLSEALRRITAWRLRACPVCKCRKLSHVKSELWTGIPGTFRCSTYRCLGCGQELFAEQYGAPMAIAEQAAWRDAKQMRPLSLPGSAELPKAIARPKVIARLPGGGDSFEHRHRRGDA